MWLNIKTENSFGAVYGTISNIIDKVKKNKAKAACITDINGTWGHVKWSTACKDNNIKPLFGVSLSVVERLDIKERRKKQEHMTFIALTNKGLKSIYQMVETAYQQFYYIPLITYKQINQLNEKDVAIIAFNSPQIKLIKRHFYIGLTPATPYAIRNIKGIDYIACCDNFYIDKGDKELYENFADNTARKLERKTTVSHLLTDKEWLKLFPKNKRALKNRDKVFKAAKVELPQAKMLKFDNKIDIKKLCQEGAKKRKLDITKGVYKKRFNREIELIIDKDYTDYFLVVADFISHMKKTKLVGHGRGSSGGSLVCYLLGITEIDPIEYGLIFERFIDINRNDLPDIDIDIQDDAHNYAISYFQKKYGIEKVAQLGAVSKLKPRSAIIRFSKALNIPPWETEELKNAIQDTHDGDIRANRQIEDVLKTDVGVDFLNIFPQMKTVERIENHVSHTSVHAAGVIVSNEKVSNYCSVNARPKHPRIAMIDKKDAEKLNLLKIDVLKLKTLTIIYDICKMIKMPIKKVYDIPVDDRKTYKVLNSDKLNGLFQIEGDAVMSLAKKMPVENILDISVLLAIGRPGPMGVGSAEQFVKRRSRQERVSFICDNKVIRKITRETLGVIIYQEQVITIIKEFAGMSWEDTNTLRKGMSKSKGDDFFNLYKKKFIKGAIKNGSSKDDAKKVWLSIKAMGQYGFNKSHSVAYAMITYISAYFKAHYPLEFALSTINREKDDKKILRLLRNLRETEGIKHIAFDKNHSMQNWIIYKGKLLGGFSSIDGVGPAKANEAVKARQNSKMCTPSLQDKIDSGLTPFKYIYPAKQIYGSYYNKPKKYGIEGQGVITIEYMKKLKDDSYVFIGCLVEKTLRDLNEQALLMKRGNVKLPSPTTFMMLKIEDDTEKISLMIGADLFYDVGYVLNESDVDKDWFLVYGKYSNKWNSVVVKNIKRITK